MDEYFEPTYTIREAEKGLIKEMTNLYIMFCLPQLIADNEGNIIDIEYKWTDDKAEKLFKKYEELLLATREKIIREQLKHSPFSHHSTYSGI